MLYTTLNLCKANEACAEGYRKLKESLPKGWGDDDPISLERVLESNGIDDAVWAFRACTDQIAADRAARLFACDCAESVLPIFERLRPKDDRPRLAIEVARRFAAGDATGEELVAAQAVAWSAARAAAQAAAWSAAWSAARAAAWDAAWSAARAAAWDAEREKQKGFLLARIREVE